MAIFSVRLHENKKPFRFRKSERRFSRFVQVLFQKKNLFLFFEKLNRTLYGLKFFPKIITVFLQKNKYPPLWIVFCLRPIKLTFVPAVLWKLDICIVFFADVYSSFHSRALFFVRNCSFCNIRQWDKSCFTCNIIPNKRALFPFFKTPNDSALINPPLLLQIVYLPFFGICVLTVICAICATPVQGRFSEQTYRKSSALAHKQALIKYYCFYDQTTQNYSTANNPVEHYLHFTPFSRPKSQQAFLCQQIIIRTLPKRRYFNAFMKNARLQYIQYNRVRLFQKSSEISAFSVVNKFSVVFLG